MNKHSITIGIVDDHAIFRSTLAYFLNQIENFKVTLEAGNGKKMQKELELNKLPDVLLLDIRMPEMNGFDAIEWLQVKYPYMPVIILSSCDNELTIGRLTEAGASAFLRKNESIEILKMAIHSVKEYGYYIGDSISKYRLKGMFKNISKKDLKNLEFSKEEWRFLELISSDLSYYAIAGIMGISETRADKIRGKLFRKLGVDSRVGLSKKAIINGIEETAAVE